MKAFVVALVLGGMLFFGIQVVNAHSGRTDAYGCHNDYISGGYHCHNSGYSSPSTSTYSTDDINSITCKMFSGGKYSLKGNLYNSYSECSDAYYGTDTSYCRLMSGGKYSYKGNVYSSYGECSDARTGLDTSYCSSRSDGKYSYMGNLYKNYSECLDASTAKYKSPVVNYKSPAPTWSCEISGTKYTDQTAAKNEWQRLVHAAVDKVYLALLERVSNQTDYSYWESKIPYNNCKFTVDSSVIYNEVSQSDERKQLLAKKEAEKAKAAITSTPQVAGASDASSNNDESSGSAVGWIFAGGFLVYIIYKAVKK